MLTDKYRYPLVIPDGSLSDSDGDGDWLHGDVRDGGSTSSTAAPVDMELDTEAFVIDTKPTSQTKPHAKTKAKKKPKLKKFTETTHLSTSLQSGRDMLNTYTNVDPESLVPTIATDEKCAALAVGLSAPRDLLQDSAMQPGFEQLTQLPPHNIGKKKLKKLKKLERGRTKGAAWFHMPATELTDDNKTDLELMMMQDVTDNTRSYRKPDREDLPKYFQVGRIQEGAADFYHSRIPKKERSKTLVDELLADAEFQKRSKKKLKDIQFKERKATITSKINRRQRKVEIAKFKETKRIEKSKRKRAPNKDLKKIMRGKKIKT